MIHKPLLVAAGLAALVACKSDTTILNNPTYGLGEEMSLSGRVCDPSRFVWLEGAKVYTNIVDPEDGYILDTVETVTDAEGRWTLEPLFGDLDYTIYVMYGSETLDMFDLHLEGDLILDDPACSSGGGGRIAVVSGNYDDLTDVLGNLGFGNVDEVNGVKGDDMVSFLTDTANLSQYETIFFDGGSIEEDVYYDIDGSDAATVDEIHEALKLYVDGGGVVVGTDWAYDVIEQTWAAKVDFLGDDELPEAAQKGEPGDITAEIVDKDLEDAIGTDEVELTFDLDTWPVMVSVNADADVVTYVSGDAPYREGFDTDTVKDAPLLVGFEFGGGRVYYSSFLLAKNADGDAAAIVAWLANR